MTPQERERERDLFSTGLLLGFIGGVFLSFGSLALGAIVAILNP